MHSDELTSMQTDMRKQVSEACTALSVLLDQRTNLPPGERTLQLRALHQALVRLARAACVLQKECPQLSSVPGLGPISAAEAGKQGGKAVRDKLGLAFFERLGKAGGRKLAEQRGANYYQEIGRRGGIAKRRKKPGKEADLPSPSHRGEAFPYKPLTNQAIPKAQTVLDSSHKYG